MAGRSATTRSGSPAARSTIQRASDRALRTPAPRSRWTVSSCSSAQLVVSVSVSAMAPRAYDPDFDPTPASCQARAPMRWSLDRRSLLWALLAVAGVLFAANALVHGIVTLRHHDDVTTFWRGVELVFWAVVAGGAARQVERPV